MKAKNFTAFALLAAALYALSAPVSKLLLGSVGPLMLAGLLYLGAGAGMLAVRLIGGKRGTEAPLTRRELPYTAGMVALDIAAPILLMLGLSVTPSATAALLNNFEVAATAIFAMLLFKERVSRRLWAAIAFITAAGMLLSLGGAERLAFSPGALLILAACVCWGIENNFTKRLSSKDPLETVVIKGFFSGAGSLAIAFAAGERFPAVQYALTAVLLGFLSYGLSIYFYIRAQRGLGAARTGAFYALTPFIGVLFSAVIFRTLPGGLFWPAAALMAVGTVLACRDSA